MNGLDCQKFSASLQEFLVREVLRRTAAGKKSIKMKQKLGLFSLLTKVFGIAAGVNETILPFSNIVHTQSFSHVAS